MANQCLSWKTTHMLISIVFQYKCLYCLLTRLCFLQHAKKKKPDYMSTLFVKVNYYKAHVYFEKKKA